MTRTTPHALRSKLAHVRPGGRQRSAATEQKILDATRALLAEGGVRTLTVEGVAARSGVAKTTIYRRYRSRDDLALAVLIDMVQTIAAVPDLGDTRAELIGFVQGAVTILGGTLMGRVMKGLVSELATDPQLAAAFQQRVVALRVAEVSRVVGRGVSRGQFRPDVDVDLVHELLFGPIYYRLLLSGGPLDAGLAERLVDAVLPAILAAGNTGATTPHAQDGQRAPLAPADDESGAAPSGGGGDSPEQNQPGVR